MQTIIVVSPQYLGAVFDEAKKYNCYMQGYGRFSSACKGILYVGATDLLGVAFLGNSLPKVKSQEYKSFVKFLSLLSNLQRVVKMTIVLKDNVPSEYLQLFKKYPSIEFYGRTGIEYVTNTLINQNVFGSLILTREAPYELKKKKAGESVRYGLPSLTVDNLISPYVLQCVDSVIVSSTLDSTLAHDEVYQQYLRDKNKALLCIRKYFVGMQFGITDDELLGEAEAEVAKVQGSSYTPLLAMIAYVKGIEVS